MKSEGFRRFAERCRYLLNKAVVPEVRDQLQLWAAEFEGYAVAAEEEREASEDGVERDLVDLGGVALGATL
jgi:hypothetical protein